MNMKPKDKGWPWNAIAWMAVAVIYLLTVLMVRDLLSDKNEVISGQKEEIKRLRDGVNNLAVGLDKLGENARKQEESMRHAMQLAEQIEEKEKQKVINDLLRIQNQLNQ